MGGGVPTPVSMKSGLEGRNKVSWKRRPQPHWCLNEVRPRRPEQTTTMMARIPARYVSMKSGLEGRNKHVPVQTAPQLEEVSMKSGLEGRNKLGNPFRVNRGNESQ